MSRLSNPLIKSIADTVGFEGIIDDVAVVLAKELEYRIREVIQVRHHVCVMLDGHVWGARNQRNSPGMQSGDG